MSESRIYLAEGTFCILPNPKRLLGVSHGAVATFVALASYANKTFTCFPSQATLAKLIRSDERTVRRFIAELLEAGLVEVSRKSAGSSNVYRLVVSGDGAEDRTPVPSPQDTSALTPQDTGVLITIPSSNYKKLTSYTHPEFSKFYEAYPKKEARESAYKMWLRHNPPLEDCLRVVKARLAGGSWNLSERQFIPNPATFINQRRWEDEVESKSSDMPLLWA